MNRQTSSEGTAKFFQNAVLSEADRQQVLPFCQLPARFLRKVEVLPNGCWQWKGCTWGLPGYLYGQIRVWIPAIDGQPRRTYRITAHRYAYEVANGVTVPKGEDVDHLCGFKLCVNPDHLEAVTHRENIVRMYSRRRLSR